MLRPSGWSPSKEEREKLLSFDGYGVDNPDIIFVGLEEYCDSDHNKQRDNIWLRCTNPLFDNSKIDKNKVCDILSPTVKTTNVKTWEMMATIISYLTGRSVNQELHDLGTNPSMSPISTLLTELRGLPRPGTNAFKGTYIQEWFGQEFLTKRSFDNNTFRFTERLKRAIQNSIKPPQRIFFYGKDACLWAKNNIQNLLSTPIGSVATGIEMGRTINGTTIVLTGFYEGQHAPTAFRRSDVPRLIAALKQIEK